MQVPYSSDYKLNAFHLMEVVKCIYVALVVLLVACILNRPEMKLRQVLHHM
jgi:hypothetical protein